MDCFERDLVPALTDAGASILAYVVTERGANTFPRLPVREGAQVFAWFARFPDLAAYERHVDVLAPSQRWGGDLPDALTQRLTGVPKTRRLRPTARSRLRA